MTTYNVEIRFGIASGYAWGNSSGCSGLYTSVYVDDELVPVTFTPAPFQPQILEGIVEANSGQVVSASLFDTRETTIGMDTSVFVCMHLQDDGWANPDVPCADGVYVSDQYRWAHQAVKLA